MIVQRRITTGLLSAAFCMTLAACGGSSGGGGSSALPEQDRAVVAGLVGLGVAQAGLDTGMEAGEEGEPAGLTLSARTAPAPRLDDPNPCDSGSTSITEGLAAGPSELDSPYHDGQFDRVRISANDCRIESGGGGFSFFSRTDGVFEFGEAEGGDVFYFRAADSSDSIEGFYQMESSGDFIGNMNVRMRGLAHGCDGCSSPEHGGQFELVSFLRIEQTLDGNSMSFIQGDSLGSPLEMRFTGTEGGTGESVINGRLGFSMTGNPCSFDAVYETVNPLTTVNSFTENETITGGELNISMVGGGSYNVQFLGPDSVMVNGTMLTEADLQRLEEQCAFDDDWEDDWDD